ncbi:glycosyltransferase family 39 protein [Methanothermobacter sp.]|uniref:glycosyltransferase family 39 protein n=1 Tax=Methanothermobacter sp. TaxID=1884223 RepID=UPI002608702E|nr:glycosyltransferase family 39 protein [Methanothermobacter sp.]MDI9617640.1 glycosyltransferase family 39 protein [Methanothermobacter sp.]
MSGDRKIISAVTFVAIIIALILFEIQSSVGIYYWDIFLYVNNAMKMAHLGPGDALYLPPFLPAVISIFFRLGFTGEKVVFAVASAFYVAAVIGMYLLLRIRFSELESLAGSISFASFSVVLSWAATGALDVPSIALSIWAVYLALLGRRRDSRFYYLTFPVAMAAFLTRYTAGLMILPIGLIIFTDPNIRSKLSDIVKGIAVGLLLYLPFGYFFYRNIKTPFPFIKQFTGTATGSATSINPGYSVDSLYYLKHIPEYISAIPSSDYLKVINPSLAGPSPTAFIILALLLGGFSVLLWRNRDIILSAQTNKKVVFLLVSVVFILTFGRISFVLGEVLIVIWALSILRITGGEDKIYVDLAMAVWFLAYLSMHSFHPVKVDRYLITALPAVAYGISLSINQLSALVRWRHASDALSSMVVLLMLSSAFYYMAGMPEHYAVVDAEKEAASWLMSHDPLFKDKVVASDRGPAFTWYLGDYVFTRRFHPQKMEMCIEYFCDLSPDYYIFNTEQTQLPAGYRVIYSRGGIAIAEKIRP